MSSNQTTTHLPDIVSATESYETWLAGYMEIAPDGIAKKHADMASTEFIFLRATYYRWAQQFPVACAELASAPQLLSVGDLHVDNFGIWPDCEGRLVWGVNDFDETAKLPYTNDLVRLALSAKLNLEEEQPAPIHWKAACAAIAEGYGDAIDDAVENISTVQPIILAETNGWLAKLASEQALDPEKFWVGLKRQGNPLNPKQQATAETLLKPELPFGIEDVQWKQREAGEGSLGRPRYLAIAMWRGGHIAREAKTLCPSAAYWAGVTSNKAIRYPKILADAIRCPDPFVHVSRYNKQDWIIRRLSPSCRRIEMTALKGSIDEKLYHAMGHETADIHLNQPKRCRAVQDHFHSLGPGVDWLIDAVLDMEKALHHDFETWRKHIHKSK